MVGTKTCSHMALSWLSLTPVTYRMPIEVGLLLIEEGEEGGVSIGREKKGKAKDFECRDYARRSLRVG